MVFVPWKGQLEPSTWRHASKCKNETLLKVCPCLPAHWPVRTLLATMYQRNGSVVVWSSLFTVLVVLFPVTHSWLHSRC